jgi:hypothetical protein
MTAVQVVTPTGTDPNITPVAQVMTATQALPYTSATAWAPALVTMELVGYASGNFTNGYLAGFGTRFVQTNGAPSTLRDKKFTVTGWITGRGSDTPAQSITLIATVNYDTVVAAATNPTDAEKLALSVERFVAPAANNAVTADLTLPTTATYGTVAWTSDTPSVISNAGVVTRPAPGQPDATVKLSYVITVGAVSSTPVEITFVVKAGEPIVTLYSANFGTTGKSGYGEGMIFQDNSSTNTWTNITKLNSDGTTNTNWNKAPAVHTVNKDRVQIATSSGIHTNGAFLVFSPISTALVAYMEFDLSAITNPGKLGFSYAIWSSADGTNFTDPTKVTSAILSLQKFDGTNWVASTSTLNLVANASATAYKSSSFDLSGAAKYRLVYTLVLPSGVSSSQNQRLTIDDVIVTDR